MLTTLLALIALPPPLLIPPAARAAELLASVLFVAILISATKHDLATLRIPDRVIVPGTAAIGAILLLATVISGDWHPFNNALIGATGAAAFYLTLHVIAKDGIGFGDVKFAVVIGLITGWHSPVAALIAPIAAFTTAGFAVIVLLLTRQINRKTQMPLAPWMALGAVASLATSF